MSDVPVQTPALPDTSAAGPTVGTPEPPAAATQPTVDYEARYGDLRSEFDRRNTLISAAQQGDVEAMRELGFEPYEEPVADPEFVDPLDELRTQLDDLRGQLTTSQQAQQQEAAEAASAGSLRAVPGFTDLTDDAQEWVWARAQQLPTLPTGLYDTDAAFAQFAQLIDGQKKTWAGTKNAPHVAAGGQAGTEVPNLAEMSNEEATAYAVEAYRAAASG